MSSFAGVCRVFLLFVAGCVGLCVEGFTHEGETKSVAIYSNVPDEGDVDSRSEAERKFQPFGFMPAEAVDQIRVNAQHSVDANDPRKGTCIEYMFQFNTSSDWMGSYTLVNGTAWGTEPGIDVAKLLGANQNEKVLLRFKARGGEGGEQVTFQCGGVNQGRFPSSIGLKRTTMPSTVRLAKQFKDYIIELRGSQLSNVIDPFCVVAVARENPGRNVIKVYVDDIRFERIIPIKVNLSERNWRDQLTLGLWVAYTPTGFNPESKPPKLAKRDDVQRDLQMIKQLAVESGVEAKRVGIVTYGCDLGLDGIPEVARDLGLPVILGIFNPSNQTEVANAEALLKREDLNATIVSCCVGNECLTFKRATMEQLIETAARIRNARAIPVTATEIAQSYGDSRLFSEFDYALVTCHAVFAGVYDAKEGAEWAIRQAELLIAEAPKDYPILIKEFGWPGWPSAPAPFSDEQQVLYWKTIFTAPVAKKVNACIFDSLNNVPWKKEEIKLPSGEKVNIGPHWPVLFEVDGTPKSFAKELLRLWQLSRAP